MRPWMMTAALFLFAGCGDACNGQPPEPAANAQRAPNAKSKAKAKAKAKRPAADVERVPVKVYYVNQAKFDAGDADYLVAVDRMVGKANPPRNALWTLFKGPTPEEAEQGLVHVASGAEGFDALVIEDGVASFKLRGGCASGGSTLTVYDLVVPTLKQFPEITAVKVLDPEGHTANGDGPGDSRPACLEP